MTKQLLAGFCANGNFCLSNVVVVVVVVVVNVVVVVVVVVMCI